MLLDAVVKREVVIGLALAGAGLAMIGSLQKTRGSPAVSRALIYLGYAVTGASVLIFIVAGFRS
jgi:hypothetical protein